MICNIVNTIGKFYPTGLYISAVISTVLSAMVFHKIFYVVISLFFTRKFNKAKKKHKFAILIPARNEEKVIGNLIDSIYKQDYPKNLYKIFVIADNCDDKTAQIARDKDTIVYERFNTTLQTKGYALEFLVDNIEKDYGINSFDGYFIFDADNLLKKNYISKMNDAFDSGEKIITSFRNTKNLDKNWIAATFALHWVRSVRTNHRARSFLKLATNIQGTGFLFSNEIIKNGWHYTSLTEDRELTADAVVQGYEISYQDEAEFYDEQPISLKYAFRQRIRWAKGLLYVLRKSGPHLFVNIIFGKKYLKNKNNRKKSKEKSTFKNIIESLKIRFMSFDTLGHLIPLPFINLCKWVLFSILIYACYSYTNGFINYDIFSYNSIGSKILGYFFDIKINIEPGIIAAIFAILITIFYNIIYRFVAYFLNTFMAIYLLIIERKRLKKISLFKKIKYILMWPIFDIIGRYSIYIALVTKVTWKPIPHDNNISIDDIVLTE